MRAYSQRDVLFKVSDVQLHGVIKFPSERSSAGILLLHPHPLFGGNMHNTIILAVEDILLQHGLATMRFDFRGVQDVSQYAGVQGAITDAITALDVMLESMQKVRFGLFGYSFGGSIALHAAALRSPTFLVTLSASFSIAAEEPHLSERLSSIMCPTLLIHGSEDSIVPTSDAKRFADLIGATSEVTIIPHANHFYAKGLDSAIAALSNFIKRCDMSHKNH